MRKPFAYGWCMVAVAAAIPILFSFAAGLSTEGLSLSEISKHVMFKQNDDMSYIFAYFSFGLMHVLLCISATYYIYNIVKNSSTIFIFKKFRNNHAMSCATVSSIFVMTIVIFDTPMEFLSSDVLWIGLSHIKSNTILFHSIFNLNLFPVKLDIKLFNMVPISLTLIAFLPASAIMMSITHFIAKLEVNIKQSPEDIVSSFINDFDVIYYLMVFLLIFSGIATHLYLQTPYSTINNKESIQYVNLINSTFSTWCMIFFLVLIVTLLMSYTLLAKKIKNESINIDIILDSKRFSNIRQMINVHFMIKRNIPLFASSFAPLILLIVKNIIS